MNSQAHTSSGPQGQWHFVHIFKASRQAFQPGKLALAAGGIALTYLMGLGLDAVWCFAGQNVTKADLRNSPFVIDVAAIPDDAKIGVFRVLFAHEKRCVDQMLKAARKLDLTSGMGDVWPRLRSEGGGPQLMPQAGQGYGVIAFGIAMLGGLLWTAKTYWFFSLLFGVVALVLWSLVGGAICRVSSLRFARDERISVKEALAFSREKLWGLVFAPVILLVVAGCCAVFLAISGWLMSVSYLNVVTGPLGGLLFVLILLAGAMMAFCLVATTVGFSLMWPSMAAEGMDCGDAISRSVQYPLDQAERTVGYAGLALVYGALVWLVVKLFAMVVLWGTHYCLGSWMPELTDVWLRPSFDALFAQPMPRPEIEGWTAKYLTYPLMRIWLWLFVVVVYGYLVSYYFTASTVIYHLLRYHVDETELDDVYDASADVTPIGMETSGPVAAAPEGGAADADTGGEETKSES